jgi:hypothetical protein
MLWTVGGLDSEPLVDSHGGCCTHATDSARPRLPSKGACSIVVTPTVYQIGSLHNKESLISNGSS